MKTKMFRYMAMAMLGGLVLFAGCAKDEEEDPNAPTVTITGQSSVQLNATAGPTYDLSFEVTINAPGKIKEIKIERTKMLGTTLVGEFSVINQEHFNLEETSFTQEDNINYSDFLSGTVDKIDYVVVVTDKNDKIGTATFSVTMGTYTALTNEQNGEIWKIHGAGNGGWNLKDDAPITSIANDAAVVALRYMINSDDVNTVDTDANFTGSWTSNSVAWTSTGGTNYVTNGNGTQYVKANGYNYANAPKEVALYLFGAGTPSTDVENPAVDDVYIGMLGEELYVIKITEYDIDAEPSKANTGVLRFSYKK